MLELPPKEQPRRTVEDIFGRFGFRVVWEVLGHYAGFTVYAITIRETGDTPGFNRKDWQSLPDPVPDIADAEVYLHGYVKWDGCADLNQDGYTHFCGPSDFVKHCALLCYIFDRAFELMGRECDDGTWDEAVADCAEDLNQPHQPIS